MAQSNPDDLLVEWFEWWHNSDAAPYKMPKALHVRTLVYLYQNRLEDLNRIMNISDEKGDWVGPLTDPYPVQ